jgi:hypothetical protein
MIARPNVDGALGAYSVWFDGLPDTFTFDFDRLRWDRYGQLGAEVTVYLGEQQLHSAWATITTTDGRAKLAGRLEKVSLDADWQQMVETACVEVRNRHRLGEPPITMADAPDVELGQAQLRDSARGDVILPANELTIAFGDGDTGKSMLALLFGAIIHTGRTDLAGLDVPDNRPMRVAYADWETSAGTQKARLRRMFGEFYPKDLLYIPGGGLALTDSIDRFRRIIREHRIGYLIVDSIAYACGGPPEDASVASAFHNALQQLGMGSTLGVLAIAHVTKADTKASTERPFGSAFWHNSARMTWYLRRNEGHGERYGVGMFCRKHNLGPRSASVGLTLDYANGGLTFTRTDPLNDAGLAGNETLGVRIHRLMLTNKGLPMTYADIAEALDEDAKVVAETCRRAIGSGMFVHGPNEGRERTIALPIRINAA